MDSSKVIITKLEMTCEACPSQWEGVTEDGRYVYIRFRWGYFSAGIGATFDEALGNEKLFGDQISDGLDGTLSTEDMRARLMEVGVAFRA